MSISPEQPETFIEVPGLKDKEDRQVLLDSRLAEALLGAPIQKGK